jgi:hypothetical protein
MARKKFQGTLPSQMNGKPDQQFTPTKTKGVAKTRLEINKRLSAEQHQFMNIGRWLHQPSRVIRSHS